MKAVLFDLDGVLYTGKAPVPGAAAAVGWFRERGVPHLFVTNTTSRPRRAIVERLGGMGLEVEAGQILTPPVAAVRWLRRNASGPAALFVPEATREEFAGLDLLPEGRESGAGAVVVGDLGKGWDFDTLNRAFRLLMAEPPPALVALGMSRYWRAEDGLRLDAAPFVAALEHASGARATILGKPAEAFFRTAVDLLGAEGARTVMVGDDVRGDVAAAQKAGLSGVLVKTGKFRPADLELGIAPEGVLDSVAALPRWWEEREG